MFCYLIQARGRIGKMTFRTRVQNARSDDFTTTEHEYTRLTEDFLKFFFFFFFLRVHQLLYYCCVELSTAETGFASTPLPYGHTNDDCLTKRNSHTARATRRFSRVPNRCYRTRADTDGLRRPADFYVIPALSSRPSENGVLNKKKLLDLSSSDGGYKFANPRVVKCV